MLAAQRTVKASIEEECRECLSSSQPVRALTLLMEAYGRDLHRYCWAMLRHKQLAEDVLQSVFLQAYQGFSTLELRSTFKNWLYGLARHRCIDELRRRKRWGRFLQSQGSVGPFAFEPERQGTEAESSSLALQLQHCLEHLRPENRELVLLRFQHDSSYEEISSLLGENPGALRTRVCRSLVALRRCIERRLGGAG